MTVRYYSSVASEKTLTGTITAGATSMVVSNTTGFPALTPFTLAVDYETAVEELVNVTNVAGTTLTISRAVDGTSASSHNAGARVRHVTSARDFADSRNHENSSNGVHGLDPAEDLVGTQKIQTLENKTVVNLQGTLLNPDINMTTSANSVTFAKSPAGSATDPAINLVNGAEETFSIRNNGDVRIRNPLADDTTISTRRFRVVMSDGTTERLYITTTGMLVSLPRAGTSTANGAFKGIDPGGSNARKMIQLRDTADAVDRFNVLASGSTNIINSDPTHAPLDIQGAVGQSASYFRILDGAAVPFIFVDSDGELNAERTMDVLNQNNPAATVLTVFGHTTQTADLQTWGNGAGTTVARVRNNGQSDFTSRNFAASIFTPAVGWTLASQNSSSKAGIATIHLALTRTGGNVNPTAWGDLNPDIPLGTVNAAFRPGPGLAGLFLSFSGTDTIGQGAVTLNTTTGELDLRTWSPGGTVSNGLTTQITMTYPLMDP